MKKTKKHCYKKCGSGIYRKSNCATFCFKLCEDFCTLGIENGLYKVLVVKRKKILKEVNNTTTDRLWQLLTFQNSNKYHSTDIHGRLDNNSQKTFYFLSVYFIRYFNNPTEITQNHFRGVFLKNHKYLREIFLRRLGDVTE